ncbi:hypothetical protein ACIQI7_21505 [Kitasatospora sp. NPDC092039]|uniref:hypothetical protein n=1 Tax=Kitasatospora sp. NPDC092039 TaxID=3364086 RepID=UPI0038216B8F
MNRISREGLDRLAAALAERIGAPREPCGDAHPVEPLRRQVRHAVTGIDAYLSAVEAGSGSAPGLHQRALDLWETLERLASTFPEPDPTEPAASEGRARVPAQVAPRP